MLHSTLFNSYLKYMTYFKRLNLSHCFLNGGHLSIFYTSSNVLTSASKIFQSQSTANYISCSLVKGSSFKNPSRICSTSRPLQLSLKEEQDSFSNMLQQRLDETAEWKVLPTVFSPAMAVSWWQTGEDCCSLALFLVDTREPHRLDDTCLQRRWHSSLEEEQ